MESETLIYGYQPRSRERVFAAVGPVLWIAISYVDPGKWAAAVEGGSRFGFDLSLLLLIINCAAILCQYLPARIAIATGKNLAQICREEYDDLTCLLLGIQAEISMIVSDLTMVLGTAYGLNAIFGMDLLISVFLTGLDVVLFPFLASLLESTKAKTTSIFLACFLLVSYVAGVIISQPESSLSAGGMLSKLTGENAFALMGVLGANIMPHNFYLHSSIVQQDQRQPNISKGALCHDHFLATLCIFSGIFMVNCMLMNSAANVFYGSGLISLTLQDALSLLDQGFKSYLASTALIFIMFFSNQLVAVTWSHGRQVTAYAFFRLEIPSWLHRATIKLIAIIPALFCVLYSGADGIFQFLIFTQVVVGLLLPSSVIPLFRVASSSAIMGAYRISRLVEFLALFSFIGMLGLNIMFFIELVFGSSDWVINLKWNIGSSVPVSYLFLLIATSASMCLMLWLAITPLKSTSSGVETQTLKWERRAEMRVSSIDRDQSESSEIQHNLEKSKVQQEHVSTLQSHQNFPTPAFDLNLPDTLLDSETNLRMTTLQENQSEISFSKPEIVNPEESRSVSEFILPDSREIVKGELMDNVTSSAEPKEVMEKTLKIDGNSKNEKDEERESWEPKESTKDVSESSQALTSEGPGSYRNLKGRNDDLGSGTGSLSRLAGLGRAGRRQLTTHFDEFWGKLFDFHGQPTLQAKARKLDVLLGVESKLDPKSASVKSEGLNKDATGYLPSAGGRATDLLRNSSFYGPMQQHIEQGNNNSGSTLGVQQGSVGWSSNQLQLSEAYMRKSNHDSLDAGERRYRSMHVPSSASGHDQQPASFHGYNMTSYIGRMVKEKGSDLQKLTTPTPSIKSNPIDSYGQPLAQKQNGMRMMKPPGFHNVPVARNHSMKSERAFHELSPDPVDYNSNNSPSAKKFHSLPDISGLYVPQRDSMSDKNSSQWHNNNSMGYGESIIRAPREHLGSTPLSWSSTGLGFNEISNPKVCVDAFSLQFGPSSSAGSLWSRQPYEQFGVADKSPPKTQETASMIDAEAKILQSFRSCIMDLLKLEGSDWLFRQDDGVDEDIIARVAARERFLFEVETRSMDSKHGSAIKVDETVHLKFMPVPNCGDGCVWRADLVISFGVWSIHRILELSLMESRPELWGKYTYVLNRLQGIIDLAFSKPRPSLSPCFCLQLPIGYQQKSSPPITNDSLPPPSKVGRGKFTTAAMLLDTIKDVEIAISCRKGRTGTAAGDVAFPKGKENLASVLKRYKRRLSSKTAAVS